MKNEAFIVTDILIENWKSMEQVPRIQAHTTVKLIVSDPTDHMRIDTYVSHQFPAYSRTFFQQLIRDGHVQLNNKKIYKSGLAIKPHDTLQITFPEPEKPTVQDIEQKTIDISIVHEHEHFLIINKPASLLVHPPHATSTVVTLIDWIKQRYAEICDVGFVDRPGIVHRLDRDTSGVLIIPRTNYAHTTLSSLFHDRLIHKTYWAVVHGHPDPSGVIDLAIGRDPYNRTKMRGFTHADPLFAQRHSIKVRSALSYYRVLEYFNEHALVEVKPVTGRTHQIRVHLATIGHPIVGDHIYGNDAQHLLARQALHARSISFEFLDTPHSFCADLPEDMQTLIQNLRAKSSLV